MKTLFNLILIALAVILLSLAVNYGAEKQKVVDCAKLQRHSAEITNFYWTDWQVEMCKDVL